MTFGVLGEPATFDPYSPLASDLTYWLARPVYPSLFRIEADGDVRPELAASIETTSTGALVTLRPAGWSDGSRIVAADVVRSVARARASDAGISGFEGLTARAVGDDRIAFRGRSGDWPKRLATLAFVLPRDAAERPLRTSGGPMKVVARRAGLGLDYVPNQKWVGDRPLLRSVKVRFTVSLEMMIALLREGTLDAAALPSSVNLDERLSEVGIDHVERAEAESIYLDMEGASGGRSARQGFLGRIDRGAIAEGLIRDDGALADAPPVPSTGNGVTPSTIQLAAPAGDELLTLMQRVIQRQLEQDGSTVELVSLDPRTFYGAWERDDSADLALRRAHEAPEIGDLDAYPMFEVDALIAWRGGLAGPDPHGEGDGPLWNVETWAVER